MSTQTTKTDTIETKQKKERKLHWNPNLVISVNKYVGGYRYSVTLNKKELTEGSAEDRTKAEAAVETCLKNLSINTDDAYNLMQYISLHGEMSTCRGVKDCTKVSLFLS